MQRDDECWLISVQPDGMPLVKLRGKNRVVQLVGITVPQPVSDAYLEVLQRVQQANRTLYCISMADDQEGVLRAKLLYYGWHDKTGDVWQDLALLLIDEGVVEVAGEDFPGKDVYVEHAAAARHRRARETGGPS